MTINAARLANACNAVKDAEPTLQGHIRAALEADDTYRAEQGIPSSYASMVRMNGQYIGINAPTKEALDMAEECFLKGMDRMTFPSPASHADIPEVEPALPAHVHFDLKRRLYYHERLDHGIPDDLDRFDLRAIADHMEYMERQKAKREDKPMRDVPINDSAGSMYCVLRNQFGVDAAACIANAIDRGISQALKAQAKPQ